MGASEDAAAHPLDCPCDEIAFVHREAGGRKCVQDVAEWAEEDCMGAASVSEGGDGSMAQVTAGSIGVQAASRMLVRGKAHKMVSGTSTGEEGASTPVQDEAAATLSSGITTQDLAC